MVSLGYNENKYPTGSFNGYSPGNCGAVVGGFVMSIFGQPGVTGFNIYSIIVAVVGAVILIGIGRALTGTRY